jgi:hypothetical protein
VHPSDLAAAPGTAATRRRVLATGAKLAYAAPLVAATMKLTAAGAGAACACPPTTKATGSFFEVTGGPHAGQCAVCSATALGYDPVADRCLLAGPKAVSPGGYVAKVCDAVSR